MTARGRRAETAPLRPAVVAERTRKRWKFRREAPPEEPTISRSSHRAKPLAEFVAQALFVFTCTGAACGQATPFSSTNPFDGSKGANSAVGTIDDGSFVPEDLPVPFVQSIAMTFGFTITALAYAMGSKSGAQINGAVTWSAAASRTQLRRLDGVTL